MNALIALRGLYLRGESRVVLIARKDIMQIMKQQDVSHARLVCSILTNEVIGVGRVTDLVNIQK
jgi:hypothetical protein